jgi:signal transduction histidine kinase
VGRLGENVAKLAHGLKNAVHSLRGFASLIEPTVGDRQGAQAALAGLRVAIDDLESLARLTLAQPTSEPARAARCDAVQVARDALDEVRRAHPGFDWALDASQAAGERPVPVAERDLREVCLALLRNAVEAGQGRGAGTLVLRDAGPGLALSVRDRGPGIPADQRERLFEPGYTTKPGGSGYGLYLARRVVVQAGGSLELDSQPGEGTSVEISLPRADAEAR